MAPPSAANNHRTFPGGGDYLGCVSLARISFPLGFIYRDGIYYTDNCMRSYPFSFRVRASLTPRLSSSEVEL